MIQVTAEYENNADYDLENSVPKAKRFIYAGRILLRRMLEEVQHSDGNRARDDYRKIKGEIDIAVSWWNANDTTASSSKPNSSTRRVSFRDFRS